MALPGCPTKDEAITLFESVEEKFPHETLGDDKWYMVVVSDWSLEIAARGS